MLLHVSVCCEEAVSWCRLRLVASPLRHVCSVRPELVNKISGAFKRYSLGPLNDGDSNSEDMIEELTYVPPDAPSS